MADVSLTGPPGGITIGDLTGDPKRLRRESFVRAVVFMAAAISILISALIVVSLVGKAWTFITQVDLSLLWSDSWNPRQDKFDLRTLITGSLLVTGVAMLIAVPVGLGSAVYLAEYAKPRARAILKPILEVLAGIPSVVLGYFALTWLAPNVIGKIMPSAGNGGSLAAAGLGVGLLSIPLVASISEDAMRSVPNLLREASAGLGAKKVTTTTRVVIPAAVSGLVAALIVAASRAIGETMVVFIAAGGADTASFTTDPFSRGLTVTAAMASQATGSDQVRGSSLAYPSLFFLGLVLFALTFGLNIIAGRFVRKYRQQY